MAAVTRSAAKKASREADLLALANAFADADDDDEKDEILDAYGMRETEDEEEEDDPKPAPKVASVLRIAPVSKAADEKLVCSAEGCTGKDLRREDYSSGQLLKSKPKCHECMRKKATARRSVTYECKQRMLQEQNGRCGICKLKFKNTKAKVGYVVDHEHKFDGDNGKLRGLLCSLHNLGISYFKDSPVLLIRALLYLEGHREPAPECATETQLIRRQLEAALVLAESRDIKLVPKEQREALYDSPFTIQTSDRMLSVVPKSEVTTPVPAAASTAVAVTAPKTVGVLEEEDREVIPPLWTPHTPKHSSIVVHVYCVLLALVVIAMRLW